MGKKTLTISKTNNANNNTISNNTNTHKITSKIPSKINSKQQITLSTEMLKVANNELSVNRSVEIEEFKQEMIRLPLQRAGSIQESRSRSRSRSPEKSGSKSPKFRNMSPDGERKLQ